jgi:ABC-type transporter Mla MlaB component
MLQATPVRPAGAPRAATAIDLIGDLDKTLATMLGETLHGIVSRGDSDTIVNLGNVAVVHEEGLAAVIRLVVEYRLRGCPIAVRAGQRRMRSLLKAARIPCESEAEGTLGRNRQVMIARHVT